jgi:hypothetical protein
MMIDPLPIDLPDCHDLQPNRQDRVLGRGKRLG